MEHRNPEQAFDHAIKVGALHVPPPPYDLTTGPRLLLPLYGHSVNDYMYMYTDNGADYFKHVDTREYYKVSHS